MCDLFKVCGQAKASKTYPLHSGHKIRFRKAIFRVAPLNMSSRLTLHCWQNTQFKISMRPGNFFYLKKS